MVKKFINLSKGAVILLSVTLLFGLVIGVYAYSWRPLPFDSKEWLQARVRGDDKTRQRMCASLIDQFRVSKPTLPEVKALLGPPDYDTGHIIYTYKVGRGPFTPFTGLLSIEIGEGDRVKRAFLVYD